MNKVLIMCLLAIVISSETVDLETAKKELVDRHNYYRDQHRVSKLRKNDGIEEIAQQFSKKLIEKGQLVRSANKYKGEPLGENLYYGLNSGYVGTEPVDVWYKGEEKFDYKANKMTEGTGHFTQLVWKNTKEIGCGISQDAEGGYYVVCNYYPAGNYFGEYIKNVFPKKDSGNVAEEDEEKDEEKVKEKVVEDTKKELEQFKKDALDRHNYYRTKHGVGKLERDSKLEKIAMDSAKKMVKSGEFKQTDEKMNDEPIGQNLLKIIGAVPDGAESTNQWYSGVKNYDFENPGYQNEAGGFTQIVWKNIKKTFMLSIIFIVLCAFVKFLELLNGKILLL